MMLITGGFSYYLAKPGYVERVLLVIVSPIYLVSRLLLHILWLIFLGVVKLILLTLIGFIALFVYLVSAPISYFGRFSLGRYVSFLVVRILDEDRLAELRYDLVQTIFRLQNDRPKLESEEEYKEELRTIRQEAIEGIERGETVISVIFGFLLFIISIGELDIPVFDFFQLTISFVEIYLFVLSVAVLYRVSFLDILAFSGDEEFDTLNEWDIAVTIQRGICQLKVVKLGLLLISVRHIFSDHQFRTAFQVFRELNSGQLWGAPRNVISRAWEIQNEEKNQSD